MTLKDPRASALALAEPVPAGAEARRIDHDAVQRAARDLLRALGADVDAAALEETPRRVGDAYAELLTPPTLSSDHLFRRRGYDERARRSAMGRDMHHRPRAPSNVPLLAPAVRLHDQPPP